MARTQTIIRSRMPVSGAKIRERREAAGKTPSEVADALPMDRSNYSKLESRENQNPKVGVLERLAEMFGCEVTDFLAKPSKKK